MSFAASRAVKTHFMHYPSRRNGGRVITLTVSVEIVRTSAGNHLFHTCLSCVTESWTNTAELQRYSDLQNSWYTTWRRLSTTSSALKVQNLQPVLPTNVIPRFLFTIISAVSGFFMCPPPPLQTPTAAVASKSGAGTFFPGETTPSCIPNGLSRPHILTLLSRLEEMSSSRKEGVKKKHEAKHNRTR